ncbi:uncharacterized protein LOC130647197 isoform X1 [Hydractinia symbiolongicarpus]|uniref:uncharacterized protein LOC130647197 isoform X1 n=1 Tax=Hydractinia symbiolongicarpus TaxID=13093 RepID=UPI00254DC6C2|nr:uncharacterized protein LOC130647197 isoform X1 [Hydractinia symbiolongicarpus]XP_057308953.1 uncharacterized protein LOC130647197 isoform X1 [Hydractinia symbiolongicarpus]
MAFSSVREDVLKLFQDEDLQKLIEIFNIYSEKWINSNKNVFLNTEQLYAVLSCGEIGVNEDALNYLPASVSSKNCVALRYGFSQKNYGGVVFTLDLIARPGNPGSKPEFFENVGISETTVSLQFFS